ncbi:MAG: type II toxin-antitoxin system RelE/ParE family toxin [Alphaproteobacteria bacterium]|nr:type II toxin-antitoxin system RelE/ParE family toxin [Alphaproteobacteria bacterium]
MPAVAADKLRNMVAFLQDMQDAAELLALPGWNAHRLGGGRAGTWSLMVTRNWRLTFRIDRAETQIVDLDYEDYHQRGQAPWRTASV